MKINIFLSVVKSISKWLHGEGSEDFRAYTWPRLKQLTRRFINLGIYEKIEGFYRIVDDTFYKGSIDLDPQDPAEVARLESLLNETDGSFSKLISDTNSAVLGATLPKFSAIKNNLLIWKSLEQGNTYRCGTFTMNNMLRSAMLICGLKPPLEVCAIDPLYVATKDGKGKQGTVMDRAFAYLAKVGFPSPSWNPLMSNHDKELKALEDSIGIKNAALFGGIKTTGNVKKADTFEEAVALDRQLPSNWLIQVSISFSPSLKYFGQLVPFLQKVGGKYNLTRTGGHSIHGVRGSFSIWEDGEAGFAIIDSAYRSSEDGWRFLKSDLFKYGVLQLRFVEFNFQGVISSVAVVEKPQDVVPSFTPTSDYKLLAESTIKFGETSAAVEALQRFLIKCGCAIPDGVTGYFGRQTQVALRNWQNTNLEGDDYTGTLWGNTSRTVFQGKQR